jgi:hypothetical protein
MVPAKTVSAQYREQLAETVTRIPVGQPQERFNDRRIISRWVFDVSCGIHTSKSWVMGAPIR